MLCSANRDHLTVQHIGGGRFAVVSRFVRPVAGSVGLDEPTLRVIRVLAERPRPIAEAAAAAHAVLGDAAIDLLIAYGLITPADVSVVSPARRRTGIKNICIEPWGGLGDVVAATALFRRGAADGFAMYARLKGMTQRQKRLLLMHNPHITSIVTDLTSDPPVFQPHETIVITPQYGHLKPNTHALNAVSTIGRLAGLDTEGMGPELFLSEQDEAYGAELTRKYGPFAVLHVQSAGPLGLKDIPPALCEAVVRRNPEVAWLQIGLKREQAVAGTINLRGVGLRRSFAAIKSARVFVGPDSVFAHAAGALKAPAVVLFGPSAAAVAGHPSAINLQLGKPCSPCLDALNVMMFCRSNYCMRVPEEALVARVAQVLRCEPRTDACVEASAPPPASAATPKVIQHQIVPATSLTFALYDKLQRTLEIVFTPSS
jgi:hypothetical protein